MFGANLAGIAQASRYVDSSDSLALFLCIMPVTLMLCQRDKQDKLICSCILCGRSHTLTRALYSLPGTSRAALYLVSSPSYTVSKPYSQQEGKLSTHCSHKSYVVWFHHIQNDSAEALWLRHWCCCYAPFAALVSNGGQHCITFGVAASCSLTGDIIWRWYSYTSRPPVSSGSAHRHCATSQSLQPGKESNQLTAPRVCLHQP